jgi:hypothetical protein
VSGRYLPGSTTTADELGLGTGCPNTTTTTTPHAVHHNDHTRRRRHHHYCEAVTCTRLTVGRRVRMQLREWPLPAWNTTTADELGLGTGCPDTTTTMTTPAVTTAVTATSHYCEAVTCARLCVDECGWSSVSNRCLLGSTTTADELGLGTGCPDTTTTTPPTSG